MTLRRSLDGLRKNCFQPKKKKKFWLWFLIFVLLGNLFYFGNLSAHYIAKSANILSLFQNGKFLIIFQNNSELRSSGGFIGSFAVAEVENFALKNLDFNTNIYALDREFAKNNFIGAPFPVAKMLKGETWALRDANYDASFPGAARNVIGFYEKETGQTVDAVIGLNAGFIVRLLQLTGPVNLTKYELSVATDNFYEVTQVKIEKDYYKDPENWAINEPKQFLKDLYPEILKKALENQLDVFRLVKNEISQKEIILYFKNPQKQAIAEAQNWAGKIPEASVLENIFDTDNFVDYLYLNSNSYSGNKSSLSVEQDVEYQVTRQDKAMLANLKITRFHKGSDAWPDGINTNWLRVFVPKEAQFVKAKLNERDISQYIIVDKESDKQSFGFEIITEPNNVNIFEISYLLPKTKSYHLFYQKQPGETDNKLFFMFDDQILYDGLISQDQLIYES